MSDLQIDSSLVPFFNPNGIVLFGASTNPAKLGFVQARNLLESRYTGAIYLVNPRGGTLLDQPLHPDLSLMPAEVDLAVILIPAPLVPDTLIACGERGIRAAVIASGGFRETGPEGAAIEAACLEIAARYQMRLLGPNCIGLLDTHLPLDTTFLPPPGPTPGDVAFISHSGAICAVVIDWARGQGFGLSHLVSLGNQADVQESDVLAPVAADPNTRVITLYLEGVRDGRRFVAEAGRIARQKPIIALKVGRFASGQQAVASHTGALAGSESAYNAAFRQAGVIRATTSEELFDWARALAWCPLPQGRGAAVLTNAGGPGVTAADALEAHGLPLATLSPDTRQRLRQLMPPAATVGNPVDMLATASPELYAACLQALLADPNVHQVMVVLPPPPMYAAGGVARALIPIIYAATKPVVVTLMGERMIQEAVEYFRAAHVPEYRFPERAAAALGALMQRASYLSRPPSNPRRPAGLDQPGAQRIVAGADPGWMTPEAVNGLLSAYQIPVAPLALARTPAEAADLAVGIGFPLALKVDASDISHKSDVGGVVLNIQHAAQLVTEMDAMLARIRRRHRDADLRGVYLQRMAPPGQEVIAGAVRDPQFGPLMMFGSGGVEVEGLNDVEFALAPLAAEDAQWQLMQTWAGRKLSGYRQLPAADKEATLDVLIRLSWLVTDFPQIAEIEINPLRVLAAGSGVVAIDARVRLAPA